MNIVEGYLEAIFSTNEESIKQPNGLLGLVKYTAFIEQEFFNLLSSKSKVKLKDQGNREINEIERTINYREQ